MLTIENYAPRIVDASIGTRLRTFGAVVIEGPKWCGKTTTARNHAVSETSMADPEGDFRARTIAELDPSLALRGEKPRLIDEWQDVPKLWDAVRYECDRTQEKGLFILTGSTNPGKRRNKGVEQARHSGAGRMARVRMDTMTLSEMSKSSGTVSLGGLFEGERYASTSYLDLSAVAQLVVHGGWPKALGYGTADAALVAREYIKAVIEKDVSEVDGIARDSEKVGRLIVSLARNESTLATAKTIRLDASGAQGPPLAHATLGEYLDALRRIYFVQDIPAWHPALRSPVRVRAASKHHLADPSLAAAALGASVDGLIHDPKTLGFLFESLATHDLLVYAAANDASVWHYRDDSGLEADLILERSDGAWIGVEVKLGFAQADDAAQSLLALRDKMVAGGQRPPSALVVVVGCGGLATARPDGVQIAPIDTLGV